jgi:hypothetical protein
MMAAEMRAALVAYDPELILDNGTHVRFVVHETDVGEYGIDPVIVCR